MPYRSNKTLEELKDYAAQSQQNRPICSNKTLEELKGSDIYF